MSKYEIIIYWSEEDKLFIAEVPVGTLRLILVKRALRTMASAFE